MTTIAVDRLPHKQRASYSDTTGITAAQRRRLDRNARELGRLMERRPELRGAYAPADLALDALIAGI